MGFLRKVGKGAGSVLKAGAVGAFKGSKEIVSFAGKKAGEYQESQRPENRLKTLKTNIQIAKAEAELRKYKPQQSQSSGFGGLNNPLVGMSSAPVAKKAPVKRKPIKRRKVVKRKIVKRKVVTKQPKYVVINGKAYLQG